MYRGRAYLEGGHIGIAQVDLAKAIELDPELGEAYFYHGLASLNQNEFALALDGFETSLEKGYENAEVYYYIRHPNAEVVRPLYRRLVLCAQGAALATETELETHFEGGIVEIMPNNALAEVTLQNLKQLNDLEYSEEEFEFATRLQQHLAKPEPLESVGTVLDLSGSVSKGSTDVGDVSWVVPTSGFSTACWVPGTPGHSWQAVASGGTSIARKGMHLAARVLAASAWDLFRQPQLLKAAAEEHRRRLANRPYQTLMEPDQKPPLDYRKPPSRS
jgi:aminobenzoyl-glutamate utilization protein B